MSQSTISTFQLFAMFPDEQTAREYLEKRLWPNGTKCPECRSMERITVRKNGYYRCNACKLDFTIRTGTIFERSHVSLDKWMAALYLFVTEPKLTSAKLSEVLAVTLKTASLVLRRIRESQTDNPFVEYRPVVGWSFYRVGDDGSIWTRHGKSGIWKPMKPTIDKYGYRSVMLCDMRGRTDKRLKRIRVCRLVCEAFKGPCPVGHECRHVIERNKLNDRAENLAWGTKQENSADMKRHGTQAYGLDHHQGKLSDADVLAILELRGKTTKASAGRKFGCSRRWIAKIWEGSARKRITYQEVIA